MKSFICTVVACGGLSHGFAQDSSPSPSPSSTATPAPATPAPSAAPSSTGVDPTLPLSAPTASPAASPGLDVTLPPVPSTPALPEPAGSPASLFPQGPQGATVPAPSSANGFQDLLQSHNGQGNPIIRKSSTATSLQELQDKIAYRDAKTKAASEAKLQQELATAQAQPTEPEFREALRAYYHDLHDRIIAINPQCKDQANQALSNSLSQLNQNRIRITTAAEVRAERAQH
ncbi:MAG: hypothetical protein QM796_22415 [Chthoniobacteraceae bacterium]